MKRSKKIILLSHCILNQNSVVYPHAKNMNDFKPLISKLMEKNIGIIQLPCPEQFISGSKRWGHVKDQFENDFYIKTSTEILESTISYLKEYKKNGYEIIGVIGIKGSPSCGITKTCRANWYGEMSSIIKENRSCVKEVKEQGVFMDVLKNILNKNNINISFIDDLENFIQQL